MSKNTTNNFFFFNDSKDNGNGCLSAMGFLLLLLCVPGIWFAILVNWIVPIDMWGVLLSIIIGSALSFFAISFLGFINDHSFTTTTIVYIVICALLGVALLVGDQAGELLDEATGKKPYTSLITNEYGQIAFWVGLLFLVFVGIIYYIYKKDQED